MSAKRPRGGRDETHNLVIGVASRGAVSPAARGIAVQFLVKLNNRSQGGVTPFPVACRAVRVHVQRAAFC